MILIACGLVAWNEMERRDYEDRVNKHAFGTMGKIVYVQPRTFCDQIWDNPTLATVENVDARNPRFAIAEVKSKITPHVGEIWIVKIIDPDTDGKCLLKLHHRQPRTHPWKCDEKTGNSPPVDVANRP